MAGAQDVDLPRLGRLNFEPSSAAVHDGVDAGQRARPHLGPWCHRPPRCARGRRPGRRADVRAEGAKAFGQGAADEAVRPGDEDAAVGQRRAGRSVSEVMDPAFLSNASEVLTLEDVGMTSGDRLRRPPRRPQGGGARTEPALTGPRENALLGVAELAAKWLNVISVSRRYRCASSRRTSSTTALNVDPSATSRRRNAQGAAETGPRSPQRCAGGQQLANQRPDGRGHRRLVAVDDGVQILHDHAMGHLIPGHRPIQVGGGITKPARGEPNRGVQEKSRT